MFTQDDARKRKSRLSQAKQILFERRVRGEFAIDEVVIPKRSKQNFVPLSFAQQRLWFLNQLEPDSSAYNLRRAVRIIGTLSIEALQKTLDALVERHEALRTNFIVAGGIPVQVIAQNRSVEMSVVDLRAEPRNETEIEDFLRTESQRPFNLSEDLLIRTTLLCLGQDDHVLLIVMHHIVTDLRSNTILLRDFAALYETLSTSKPPATSLAELPVQYADFAVWQREWLQGEVLEEQLSYWKQQLGDHCSTTELPTDHPRPAIQSFRGERLYSIFPTPLLENLKTLSRQEGVTLFMTLLAAFQVLLHRYTGGEEITVGAPIANRTRPELEAVVGFFLNTLVLRTNLSGDPTFRELLCRVREVALGAYAHQDLPFEKLVEELQPERSLSRTPLFNLTFALQNAPTSTINLPGLTASIIKVERGASKFDLSLSMYEEADGLRVSATYNTDLFESATIRRMLGDLQILTQSVADNPTQRLSILGETVASKFVPSDASALGQGGKSDRDPLPLPGEGQHSSERPYQPPRGQLEYVLTQVWEEVLGISHISVRDNFFELGGHSLLAVQMIDRIEQLCGTKLHLNALFAEATIEHLAKSCAGLKDENFQPSLLKIQPGGSRRPFFFVHGDFNGGGLYCLNLARHIGQDQPFYAFAADGFDGQLPHASIEAVATRQLEILRSFQPCGPYLLGGFCNGALTAFEMARLLHEQGQRIDLLVLIHGSARSVPYRPLLRVIESIVSRITVKPEKELEALQLIRYYFSQLNKLSRSEQLTFTLKKVKRMIQLSTRLVDNRLGKQGDSSEPKPASVDDTLGPYTRHGAELSLRYFKARDRYVLQTYPGRVTLLWPSEASGESVDDAAESWRRVAADVSVHLIPGHHISCITTHHQALAEKLKLCLESVRVVQ